MTLISLLLLQEITAQSMWTSVSLLPASMEEAARIWSTLISVCVRMASQVGGTSYLLPFSYLLTKHPPSPAALRVVSVPVTLHPLHH